ncbi:hypothetical protein GGS20DRAFT_540733 [Poronia punctata]|nr:hypothetical protein GGS20DRAFT_540733 [Poronia punctata]
MTTFHSFYNPYQTQSQPLPQREQYPYPVLDPELGDFSSHSQPTPGYWRRFQASGPPPISLRTAFLAPSPSRRGERFSSAFHPLEPLQRPYSDATYNHAELPDTTPNQPLFEDSNPPNIPRPERQLAPSGMGVDMPLPPPGNQKKAGPPHQLAASAVGPYNTDDYIPPRRQLPFRDGKGAAAQEQLDTRDNSRRRNVAPLHAQMEKPVSLSDNTKRDVVETQPEPQEKSPNRKTNSLAPKKNAQIDKPASQLKAKGPGAQVQKDSKEKSPTGKNRRLTRTTAQKDKPNPPPKAKHHEPENRQKEQSVVQPSTKRVRCNPRDVTSQTHPYGTRSRNAKGETALPPPIDDVLDPPASVPEAMPSPKRYKTTVTPRATLPRKPKPKAEVKAKTKAKAVASKSSASQNPTKPPIRTATVSHVSVPSSVQTRSRQTLTSTMNEERLKTCEISEIIDTHLREGIESESDTIEAMLTEVLIARALRDEEIFKVIKGLPG